MVRLQGSCSSRTIEQLQANKYVFGTLIDATPSHRDTVFMTLLLIEDIGKNHEQRYLYVEADMQIYKVAIHIKWSDPSRWKNLGDGKTLFSE